MKKYFIIIATLLLSLTSCEPWLDIPQKSVVDLDTFYANAGPDEAEQLIAAVYKSYYNDANAPATTIFLDILSDDHYVGGNGLNDMADNHRYGFYGTYDSSMSNVRNKYQSLYRIIFYCNLILEKIPATDNAVVNRVKAEAEFFRALCMFDLMRWFGTPPLVKKTAVTDEERFPANTPHDQTIAWCLETMQTAVDGLPAIAGKGQQEAFGGRISKHAAIAYMGKMCLWYGTRYDNDEYVDKSVDYLETVINSNLYELVSDIDIHDSAKGDFSTENLFEHNAADNDGYPSNQALNIQLWYSFQAMHWNGYPSGYWPEGWNYACPTGDFGRFLEEHEADNTLGVAGKDTPRFKATVITYDQLLALPYDEGVKSGLLSQVHDCEGYFRNKYLLMKDEKYSNTGTACYMMANWPFLRYNEVLLLHAEAKFLTDNDADGKGLESLNTVRERAKLNPLTSLTYQGIKDERRAELWGYQERYFDLVRWDEAATKMKDKGKIVTFFHGYKPGTTEHTPENWLITSEPSQGLGWQDKYELLPFPSTQLAANPNLVQNTGW